MSAFPDEVGTAVRTKDHDDAPVVEVLCKPFSPAALLSIMRAS
jgi:hypothetical protein